MPTVGLAPALHAAAFDLTVAKPVTQVVHVRQDYLVARLVKRRDPDPTAWTKARAEFRARWRQREAPLMIDGWLSAHLKGAPLWVDMKRLRALSLKDLGLGP